MSPHFDWQNARRPLPFKGTAAFEGSKTTAVCPRCGGGRYGYHAGRFKNCPVCGYDRLMERKFEILRDIFINKRSAQTSIEQWVNAIAYYTRVYGTLT